MASAYVPPTEQAFPWLMDELRGAASGAGVDPLDLITSAIEEIANALPAGRCSDFVALPPATGGNVLLGHNNDLSPLTLPHITLVEWELPDHPKLLTVGVAGIFVSIGVNECRLALTGNDLSATDERLGIPRLLIARAILSARTVDEAVKIALHDNRASSYNNIISDGHGVIANVEGSATDYEVLQPVDGWLVHTNHYTHPRMLKYERTPNAITTSVARYNRARELMQTRAGYVTPELLRQFLSDHMANPVALCRHDENTRTVFSAVIDLTRGTMDAAVGNPCQSVFERVWQS